MRKDEVMGDYLLHLYSYSADLNLTGGQGYNCNGESILGD